MDKNSSTSSSEWWRQRGSLLAVLLTVLAFAGLNRPLAELALRFNTNDTFLVITSHQSRLREVGDVDVLLLGDSSLRSSVDPRRFQQNTGLTALNLGTLVNGGLMTDYELLEAYLAGHAPPRAVVLVHSPLAYGSEPDSRLYDSFFATARGGMLRVLRNDATFLQGLDSLLRGLFPAYQYKEYIEPVVRSIIAGQFDRLRSDAHYVRRFREDRRTIGFYPDSGPPPRPGPMTEVAGFHIPRVSERALDALLELARHHTVPVWVVHGPMLSEMVTLTERSAAFEIVGDALRKRQNAGLLEIATDHIPRFEAHELAGSTVHTSSVGARRFTDLLSGLVLDRWPRP